MSGWYGKINPTKGKLMNRLNEKVEGCVSCENNSRVPHFSCMYVDGGAGHAGHTRGHCTADLCY